MSASNSLSGRLRELDQIPPVGDPTHMVQLGTPTECPSGATGQGGWYEAPEQPTLLELPESPPVRVRSQTLFVGQPF